MQIDDVSPSGLYSRKQVASLLGISVQLVGRLEARGDLQGVRVGAGARQPRRRYQGAAVLAFLIRRGWTPSPRPADSPPLQRAVLAPAAAR